MGKAWDAAYAEMKKWVGYCEKKTNETKYIMDKTANAGYNEFNYFAYWFDTCMPGWLNKKAFTAWCGWCTAFVPYPICKLFGGEAAADFFHIKPGKSNLILSVGCTANPFKAFKQYYPRGEITPRAGDIIFIDSGKLGRFCHIGWVTGISSNGKVCTIEGNAGRTPDLPYCGGCVAEHQFWQYDQRITGYARPDWAMLDALLDGDKHDEIPKQDVVKGAITPKGTLRNGAKGDDVVCMQNLLLAAGESLLKYGADGDFGAETLAAVKSFQRSHGLVVDGVCGVKTWAALERFA